MTLHQWFAAVLRRAGVDATPGSSPAAVASTLSAHSLSGNAIMASVDWAAAYALYQNYLCILPSESLGGEAGILPYNMLYTRDFNYDFYFLQDL